MVLYSRPEEKFERKGTQDQKLRIYRKFWKAFMNEIFYPSKYAEITLYLLYQTLLAENHLLTFTSLKPIRSTFFIKQDLLLTGNYQNYFRFTYQALLGDNLTSSLRAILLSICL